MKDFTVASAKKKKKHCFAIDIDNEPTLLACSEQYFFDAVSGTEKTEISLTVDHRSLAESKVYSFNWPHTEPWVSSKMNFRAESVCLGAQTDTEVYRKLEKILERPNLNANLRH